MSVVQPPPPHHDHLQPQSPTQPQPEPQPHPPTFDADPSRLHQPVEHFIQPSLPPNDHPVSRNPKIIPTRKETVARKLQRIDILLNLVYSRVTNDRSLLALFPYLSEKDAYNLASNFTYIRHQQDNQEIKPQMTDKQIYRIFRHHYRAEQRLADSIRHLRHSTSKSLSKQPTHHQQHQTDHSAKLTRAIHDLENNTALIRARHLKEVHSELTEMSQMYTCDQDLLYMHEFSQPQQITTMQARCVAMKDEYEADDLRKGRFVEQLAEKKQAPQSSISGPEEWEHPSDDTPAAGSTEPGFGLMNGQWTPPDPPRSPSPNQHPSPRTGLPEMAHINPNDDYDVLAEDRVSMVSSKAYRQRVPPGRYNADQSAYRYHDRETRVLTNQTNHESKTKLFYYPERQAGRSSAAEKPTATANPHRTKGPQYPDPRHQRQHRHSRRRPPLHDYNRGRRHRQDNYALYTSSTRPGRSQRKSRTPWAAEPKDQYYSNEEFATMPNLRRLAPSRRKETSYDDAYTPYQSGSARYYANAESIDPFGKPYPHQSVDAFGWKPPQGILSSQYNSDFAADHQVKPVTLPPAADPYAQEHELVHNVNPMDGSSLHAQGDVRPTGGMRKKWDEWRYHNGLSSGLFEDKHSGGVMHSIANMVKGRKGNSAVPHNPIEAMQLARKDPVKFMTTMVAGEVMPQAKRKARKFEAMLANEPNMTGQVGQVLSKVTKNSKPHGNSSNHGITGHVGKKLAKMTMDAAMGGSSSKQNASGQLGNALAKVAKESLKQSGNTSGGGGMINKVMNSLGTK